MTAEELAERYGQAIDAALGAATDAGILIGPAQALVASLHLELAELATEQSAPPQVLAQVRRLVSILQSLNQQALKADREQNDRLQRLANWKAGEPMPE